MSYVSRKSRNNLKNKNITKMLGEKFGNKAYNFKSSISNNMVIKNTEK